MKKLLFIICLLTLLSCNKDDDSIKSFGKIEYRVTSEYTNDNIQITYTDSDGNPVRKKNIITPYSIIFENFKTKYPRISGWRPSLSSGDITVEIYLNDALVDSVTEGRAKYVANAAYYFD